jgi:hypothetical protein
MDIPGHSQISLTLGTYSHVLPAIQRSTFALRATVDILRMACHPNLTQTMA